jgi:hypothetical protein
MGDGVDATKLIPGQHLRPELRKIRQPVGAVPGEQGRVAAVERQPLAVDHRDRDQRAVPGRHLEHAGVRLPPQVEDPLPRQPET